MKRNKPKDNGVQFPFNDIEFINKWQEWLQYRSERKLARYVPTGLKRTFTKLYEDSGGKPEVAVAIIEQSLSMGWQGLFPVKNQQTNQNGAKSTTASAGVNTDILKQKLADRINGGR